MPRQLLSNEELGAQERRRRLQVISFRLPHEAAADLARRAAKAHLTRQALAKRLLMEALGPAKEGVA